MPISFKDFAPETLEEAVNIIVNHLDDAEIRYLRNHGFDMLHLSTGMTMRNEWGLWRNSKLAQHFKQRFKLGHADDMSGIIYEGVMCKLHDQYFRPDSKAQYYRRYWERQGIDPLTQEELSKNSS